MRGEWDRALDLFVVEGPFPPPIPRAMLTSMRLQILQHRGDDVGARVNGLRPFWRREGAVAIHAAAIEMVAAGRKDDPAAAVASYDEAVAVLSRIWHEWFSARIRLAAVAIGVLADAMARRSGAEREELVRPTSSGCTPTATIVLDRYTDPSGHWGPEGRAWVKRLDAETLRARWQAGRRRAAARRARRDLARDRDAVRRLRPRARAAPWCAPASPASCAPPATWPAPASSATRPAPWPTSSAPSRCSTSSRRSARRRRPGPADPAAVTLTAREREILGHVADGRTNGEIAKLLFISAKTVSVHVSNILGKLDASGRTEAAAIARRRGLLD